MYVVFFFELKTAYEMRISDWSSDVCSSDLASTAPAAGGARRPRDRACGACAPPGQRCGTAGRSACGWRSSPPAPGGCAAVGSRAPLTAFLLLLANNVKVSDGEKASTREFQIIDSPDDALDVAHRTQQRSEEHTYELQSLMRISYAVFCLKKK